jgi:hypothetical protein
MSLGLRADPTNTSAVISVAGTDQVVITNAGNVTATTFTGALVGNAATATALSTATAGTAPSYAARAWVSFSGTQDTTGAVSSANTNRFINGSGNVTSVLRQATGQYYVYFSTPMPDARYAFSLSAHHLTGSTPAIGCSAFSYQADSLGIFTYLSYANNTYVDLPSAISVVIYR